MNVLTFIEGKRYTSECLKQVGFFSNSENLDEKDRLKRLISLGVLSEVNKYNYEFFKDLNLSKEEIEDLEDRSDRLFVFKYVGMLEFNSKSTILIYPKYFSLDSVNSDIENDLNYFKTILRVIDLYNKDAYYRLNSTYFDNNSLDEHNLSGVSLAIIDDYLIKDLYFVETVIYTPDMEGKISWKQTLDKVDPIIINEFPIYPVLIKEHLSVNNNDFITLIQIAIINEISTNFSTVLSILDYPPLNLASIHLPDLGTEEFLINYIYNQLSKEFIDFKKETLNLLLNYLHVRSNSKEGLYLVGSRKMNNIWEEVVREYYGSDMNKTYDSLKLKRPEYFNANHAYNIDANKVKDKYLLKDNIQRPKWYIDDLNNNSPIETSTFRLDSLKITKSNFNIYDAKYYNIEISGGKIINPFSIYDISKEFMYQMIFQDVIRNNSLNVSNTFIVPTASKEKDEISLAKIELDIFTKNLNHAPIEVKYRYTFDLYNYYLGYFE